MYTPWLTEEPLLDTGKTKCCSSALFIPGLEGTRLYKDGPGIFGVSTSTNTLWEPNRNDDVKKLYLDSSGSSIDMSIYSGDPMGYAFGVKGIYGNFMKFLDTLRSNGVMREWKAFGYDWRKPITEVVAGNEKKSGTTTSLVATVEDMATRSPTGKVTIIAHSNGGLVTKYLVKVLKDLGKSDLIDSVISVAVPYFGTPGAIGSLLHGDDQSMFAGKVLSKDVARGLGENMPSAYSLLPSREYFKKIFWPTIAFASSTVTKVNDGSYPQIIDSFDGQSSFISNATGGRFNASSSDVSLPIKGNDILMAAADAVHSIIDPFLWPVTIARWAVIGWNNKTTSGIVYDEKKSCHQSLFGNSCKQTVTHGVSNTSMGDGTVVAPSAAYTTVGTTTNFSIDLKQQSILENRVIKHANILESSTTQSAIRSVLENDPRGARSTIIEKVAKLQGVTIGEPNYGQERTFLVLSTHSPVELHVYDKEGHHTGVIPKPNDADEEDGLFMYYDNEIPNSTIENIGTTDDPEYEITLPDDTGENYSIVVNGVGVGEFTLDVSRERAGITTDKIEFSGMPVTPLTVATTSVLARMSESEPIKTFISNPNTSLLNIDVDGNGSTDIEASSTLKFDPIAYLESIKKVVITVAGGTTQGKGLIRRIDSLETLIKNGKKTQSHKVAIRLDKHIDHMRFGQISESDRKQIIDMIDIFISQFE